MQHSKTILSLTIDLLAHHAFDHLKDKEISTLHGLILKLKEPLSPAQQNLLMAFWRHADTSCLPAALLYRCNLALQQKGQCLMGTQLMEMGCY